MYCCFFKQSNQLRKTELWEDETMHKNNKVQTRKQTTIKQANHHSLQGILIVNKFVEIHLPLKVRQYLIYLKKIFKERVFPEIEQPKALTLFIYEEQGKPRILSSTKLLQGQRVFMTYQTNLIRIQLHVMYFTCRQFNTNWIGRMRYIHDFN